MTSAPNGIILVTGPTGSGKTTLYTTLKQLATPEVNVGALEAVLLRVSEMVCELPWIREMDINPLIVDENDAVAVDARIAIENLPLTAGRYDHMAPSHLTTSCQTGDGITVSIRPIRPEDADMEQEFVKHQSSETKYFRLRRSVPRSARRPPVPAPR